MHSYLSETEYAVSGLFDLIGDEGMRCEEMRNALQNTKAEGKRARAILYAGAPPSAFGEDTTPYFEKRTRDARRKSHELEVSIAGLQAAIAAKAFSVRALAGSILQIAKQGIVVKHGSLSNCPSGRDIGQEVLKNVIWQARNQAMQWEENSFNDAVTACFCGLERSFGNQFRIGGDTTLSLAKVVIDLLQWTNYDAYLRDMQSLIE